ncbi:hypothetical protein QE364_001739 [Nocardioides zeae]|uniref:Uncharacterized protein n=1 Tax=Nocardioides zeae TaxID=1457234 RepID=A0ACC6IH35_9ACTN|nr:hypothetical protein [Nocardioides zeae]MDR6173039.1 hypothetical protein [Nocardioides zeae]MDR6210032.1 hypothetical protein [Nocardioides zeae]
MDPSRPMLLRPGAHVARRTDGHLHVGFPGAAATTVPDADDVRRLLTARRSGTDPEEVLGPVASWSSRVRLADERLRRRDLVVDATSALAAARTADLVVADGAAGVAALLAADPGGGATRAAARRGHGVAVRGAAHAGPLVDLLRRAMLTCTTEEADAVATADGIPTVVATVGEPDRAVSDTLVREGRDHLWLAVLPDRVRVGPFVAVGATACLRCLDAAHREEDPQHPVVLAQSTGSPPGVLPPPVDPVGLALGAAVAARDVVRYVDGGVPLTWSTTVEVFPGDADAVRAWPRHPWCGCSWQDGTDPPG